MILIREPMTLTFGPTEHLNISATICFVCVASVQLFQRGVKRNEDNHTGMTKITVNIQQVGVERLINS